MFRALLFSALVASSLATFGFHLNYGGYPFYGLDDLLLSTEVTPALNLLQIRYPGIQPATAAQIIRSSIQYPPSSLLTRIKYSSVPKLRSGKRLRYLQKLYGALPSNPLYISYGLPLSNYLSGLNFDLDYNPIVDPLAVVDYYSAIRGFKPRSVKAFNKFFAQRLLGLTGPSYASYVLPSISSLVSKVNSFKFSQLGSYFYPVQSSQPISQVNIGDFPYYGLQNVLLSSEISPALKIVYARYPGIDAATAAQIVRLSVQQLPSVFLPRIKYTSVPSISSGLRLNYLHSLYNALPAKALYTSYASPLTSYLANMGIITDSYSLANPLALTDYVLGINQVVPGSQAAFNEFFAQKLLGLTKARYTSYSFPSVPSLISRLNSFKFAQLGKYFQPIVISKPLSHLSQLNTGVSYYGLGDVLVSSDIEPSLKLVYGRYPGIDAATAAQIIRVAIQQPPSILLPRIKYTAVPSIRSGLRLNYLRALYNALPAKALYTSYASPLTSYLANMGIITDSYSLVNPLALTDYVLGINQVAPKSITAFNQFFAQKLLGLTSPPYISYSFPSVSRLYNTLNSLKFSRLGSYFRPLSGSPFGRVAYSGPGSSFLSLYSTQGLPAPLNPSVTLSGLNSYLGLQKVPVSNFVSYIRKKPLIPLLSGLRYSSLAKALSRRVSFLTGDLLRRDLAPVLAARYQAFPVKVRNSLFSDNRRASFGSLCGGYFKSNLVPTGGAYNSAFVANALGGFDKYISNKLHRRYKGYNGSFWSIPRVKSFYHKY